MVPQPVGRGKIRPQSLGNLDSSPARDYLQRRIMASILPIIIAPDPRLNQPCAPVAKVTPEIAALMDDMLETMYDAPGIGLAAPQVGHLLRLIVVDVSKDPDNPQPYQMVNPEVVWTSDETFEYEEGCLSLPDHYAEVTRPKAVRVRYLDRAGKEQEIEAEGLLAVCLQHEIDHLEGTLFVDHISKLKRNVILRKLQKTKKQLRIQDMAEA
jgi:peptide deformylase